MYMYNTTAGITPHHGLAVIQEITGICIDSTCIDKYLVELQVTANKIPNGTTI